MASGFRVERPWVPRHRYDVDGAVQGLQQQMDSARQVRHQIAHCGDAGQCVRLLKFEVDVARHHVAAQDEHQPFRRLAGPVLGSEVGNRLEHARKPRGGDAERVGVYPVHVLQGHHLAPVKVGQHDDDRLPAGIGGDGLFDQDGVERFGQAKDGTLEVLTDNGIAFQGFVFGLQHLELLPKAGETDSVK